MSWVRTVTFRAALHVVLQVLCAFRITAQNPDPVRIPFDCREDELQRAGMDCAEARPCAVYLELNAVSPNGRKLFVAGNLHSSSATLDSVLLMSADEGATWKEAAARIPGAALDLLQFYDLEHGWAAGETQDPLPRDPFFLVTSTGGDSWRRRPVSDGTAPGAILSFRFDSAQHGELLVDAGNTAPGGRYLSYESQTGGESWMIRGTDTQMPKMSRTRDRSGSEDWRIRAAEDGKSWLVERRTGEQWAAATSFLIEVASCRGAALHADATTENK